MLRPTEIHSGMTRLLAVGFGLLSVQFLSGCCPSFMDGVEWRSLQDHYKTDRFTNDDFNCKSVPVSVFYQNDCLEMFALRWYCLKQCLKHCGNNLADISTVICPLRHQFICRNPSATPDDIDFQCSCVKRSKPGFCLTKLYTLDDLAVDFNATCLTGIQPLLTTTLKPQPLVPVTVLKPDGPILIQQSQDEITTVAAPPPTPDETSPVPPATPTSAAVEESESPGGSTPQQQQTSKKSTAKTTAKQLSNSATPPDGDEISSKAISTGKPTKSATAEERSSPATAKLSSTRSAITADTDGLSSSRSATTKSSAKTTDDSISSSNPTSGANRNTPRTTEDSVPSGGTISLSVNNKKITVGTTEAASDTSNAKAKRRITTVATTDTAA